MRASTTAFALALALTLERPGDANGAGQRRRDPQEARDHVHREAHQLLLQVDVTAHPLSSLCHAQPARPQTVADVEQSREIRAHLLRCEGAC